MESHIAIDMVDLDLCIIERVAEEEEQVINTQKKFGFMIYGRRNYGIEQITFIFKKNCLFSNLYIYFHLLALPGATCRCSFSGNLP